jgi:hypothetical protein
MASALENKAKEARRLASGINPALAATRYVNAGLADLGLKPVDKQKLRKQMVPIVQARMESSRGRTATRTQAQATRETKQKMLKAKNNI